MAPNRRLIILIVVIVAALFGLVIYLGLRSGPVPAPHKTEFVGFEELLTRGATDFQIPALESAINKYLSESGLVVNTVELKSGTIEIVPRLRLSEENEKVDFDLLLDGQSYQARVEYIGLKAIRLTLSDNSGKQIFDSGETTAEIEEEHVD